MTGAVGHIRSEVAAALASPARVVLAVSGGADSMTLLDAAAAVAPGRIARVATFDHRTGDHARAAAALVERAARALGLRTVVGRAERPLAGADEAAWREARWRFLRDVAAREGARVATAHTRDDQAETVAIRLLRGAGPRGLAGLYARSDVDRPLLEVGRAEVLGYVAARDLDHATDPANASRAHLRNRIRLDLLPLLRAARPALPAELLAIARAAATWRASVERVAGALGATVDASGVLHVAARSVSGYSPEALGLLWPAVLAPAGVTLDRRGTVRLVEFTSRGRNGQAIQVAGGFEVMRKRDEFVVRRAAAPAGE